MVNPQRKRLLLIQQALWNLSSETHPLSAQDLCQYCYDHGVETERKAIYQDLACLEQEGWDLVYTRSPKPGTFLATRLFEDVELRLLADAILASPLISAKQSRQLLEKLSKLTNETEAQSLKTRTAWSRTALTSETVFYTLDQLYTAIHQNRPVTFTYFDWTINRQKQYRYARRRYRLVPYALIWENQRYYCVGYDQRHQDFVHYRIDKMDQLRILEETCEKLPFDPQQYTTQVFKMYHGPVEQIVMQADLDAANMIFDELGQEFMLLSVDEKTFTFSLSMSIAPTFISWLFQMQDKIRVLRPQSLIEEIKKMTRTTLECYSTSS